MCATRNKRNSLPSLSLNKFFVNKRASMFEKQEEAPPPGKRDWKEWSPCGLVESSQRKMAVRKEKERKNMMRARLKRQADPYAEESSDAEDDDELADSKACRHASRSVNFGMVKKTLKQGQPIGECTQCRKGHRSELNNEEPNPIVSIRLLHYLPSYSDPHCLILNTQAWNIWCYECDSEVYQTSSKKLHEVVECIKRQRYMAPRRTSTNRPAITTPQFSGGGESGALTVAKGSLSSFDDNSKAAKNQRNAQASVLASLPKVKGLSNLGNTCFFNSVMQSLSQTHFLTQLLDLQCQSGQRVYLPGHSKPPQLCLNGEVKRENGRVRHREAENEDDDDVELVSCGGGGVGRRKEKEDDVEVEESRRKWMTPLDLYLPEGGGLTLATATLLKEMHSIGKNSTLNPGYLFGQLHGQDAEICKKSTQFQGYEQQDAHELLRCLLEAIRNEEILRTKRAILKAFALSEKTDPNTVSPRLKTMIKGYGRQATHTIVDQIFGGQLISTIFCEECHWSSQVFEPMMDLSLPINEEKGKPKKNSMTDEVVIDCFGRPTPVTTTHNHINTTTNTTSNHSGNSSLSKHQLKKQKKAEKKQYRGQKGRGKGKGGGLAPSCIRPNNEDDDTVKTEKIKRRTTEKSQSGDQEDLARKVSRAAETAEETTKRGESSRFKKLMATRRSERQKGSGEEGGSDEDSEYDIDDDEEEDSLGGNDKDDRRKLEKGDVGKEDKVSKKEEETEGSEEEDSEETESESKADSDATSSKKKGSSTETSDATSRTTQTRTVCATATTTRGSPPSWWSSPRRRPEAEGEASYLTTTLVTYLGDWSIWYLNTCYSSDQLNYNSASDTSERYFTPYERDCNGLDTGDDLDHYHDPQAERADNASLRSYTTNTSGKCSSAATGDNFSISSGETVGNYDMDHKVPVDQAHMDEMCLKVKELKIRRKSCSKESLLGTQRLSQKRGSTETLHTFKEKPEEEDESVKKAKFLKKLKQEWIARSLTTLAPRYQCRGLECSVMSCLTHFTAPELLTGNNKITCENCTKQHNKLHPGEYYCITTTFSTSSSST
ncbi:Ubiquitin carboxyl-terminal hydrolase 16 [Chionoecetes opilio]|uniref:Ubiquitin carboxyl-terminal hydrolase 16 n=1 Tax=Chionoecetes opilio TaxID=41210 RepID=A0A8J5D3Q5_CHIOP|nr:Ubiquitin carboxyl-terminal hydrolase 16 [Chionoecetes opilio]